MKDKKHLKERDLLYAGKREPLIKIEGKVPNLNKINSPFQANFLRDETSVILELKTGSLSNQASLYKLLGYAKEPKSLQDLMAMCHKDQLFHALHVCNKYIDYCQKKILIQDLSSLSITFKMRKNNGSFIKVICQISVWESHENQLTKLLIKLTDISFISSDCDLAWTLQADTVNRVKFKNLVATKFINAFSPRELEIVKEICTGNSNPQIARKLFISNHTVATHRKNIFKKSDCHSASSLYSYCRQRGLI